MENTPRVLRGEEGRRVRVEGAQGGLGIESLDEPIARPQTASQTVAQ